MRKLLFLCLFVCAFRVAIGQDIQWADRVITYSSAYDTKTYSPEQALGPPSILPATGRNTTAWSPRYPDMGREFIKVGFRKPQQVTTLWIGETFHPGAVKEVILFDEQGVPHAVYQNKRPVAISAEGRMWKHTIPTTPYKVQALQITLQTDAVPGYNQIDCIGIAAGNIHYTPPIALATDSFLHQKENLGTKINSVHGEVHPVISPDGKTLFFTRKQHPANYGVERRDDIWYSEKIDDSTWTLAKNIGPPLNNRGHNYLNAITTDGTIAFLGGAYGDVNARDRLYRAQRTPEGWTHPKEVVIDNYYNLSGYNSFHISVDGDIILLSIEQQDTYGLKDLYVSFKQPDGTYSAPRNLGRGINTAGDEVTPFLAADGKTLYFSTDGRPGYGRNDIFITRRLDDTWQRWSEPLNLGPAVNTANWDAYYTLPASGDYAYFTSYEDSYGSGDLFRIAIPPSQQPEAVVLIRGRVTDATTQEPIPATVRFRSEENKQAGTANTHPDKGTYQFVVPVGDTYYLEAEAPGYYALTRSVDVQSTSEYEEFSVMLPLYPIKAGEVIPLENIEFEANSTALRPSSFPELKSVAGFLLSQPEVVIEIGGHTNNLCSSSYCKQLSTERAKSVANFLHRQGVPKAQVKYKGYGKEKPIDTNDTEEGRQRNQRVEFTILEAPDQP